MWPFLIAFALVGWTCEGASLHKKDELGPPSGTACQECTVNWDPVCDRDGKYYQNRICAESCHRVNDVDASYCDFVLPDIIEPEYKDCDCAGEFYNPVCSLDGELWFSNICLAKCNNVPEARPSYCQNQKRKRREQFSGIDDCRCSPEWDPVCGSDLFTHWNLCKARCNGVEDAVPGACFKNDQPLETYRCFCDNFTRNRVLRLDFDTEVCGTDGKTYPNWCDAECKNITSFTEGSCTGHRSRRVSRRDVKVPVLTDHCGCTQELDLVCGSNGATYTSPCVAQCHGVVEYTEGMCPPIDKYGGLDDTAGGDVISKRNGPPLVDADEDPLDDVIIQFDEPLYIGPVEDTRPAGPHYIGSDEETWPERPHYIGSDEDTWADVVSEPGGPLTVNLEKEPRVKVISKPLKPLYVELDDTRKRHTNLKRKSRRA